MTADPGDDWPPIRIDVAVSDLEAAARFYAIALEATPVTTGPSGDGRLLAVGRHVLLRLCDEATHQPSPADQRYYERGKGPRMELRVAELSPWIARAVQAGATLTTLLTEVEGGPPVHAQFLDPFGHLWSLALDQEGSAAPAEEEEDDGLD
jgi:uncharacterized glyoxalase superfamily protein PhnB